MKKACVRQVALDKWLPLTHGALRRFASVGRRRRPVLLITTSTIIITMFITTIINTSINTNTTIYYDYYYFASVRRRRRRVQPHDLPASPGLYFAVLYCTMLYYTILLI